MTLPEIILYMPVAIYFAVMMPFGIYLVVSGTIKMWRKQ